MRERITIQLSEEQTETLRPLFDKTQAYFDENKAEKKGMLVGQVWEHTNGKTSEAWFAFFTQEEGLALIDAIQKVSQETTK